MSEIRVDVLTGDYLEVSSKEKKAFAAKGLNDHVFDDNLRGESRLFMLRVFLL